MAGLQAIICGMINWRSLVAALAAIATLFCAALDAAAQSYPQRPVRLIVPAPAFGLVPQSGAPEEFGAWAAQERQRWTRVVKQSGAKAE